LSDKITERPRVAIFQAHWRLHSNTVFAARMLAQVGYRVDMFLYKVDVSLAAGTLDNARHIFVHSYAAEMLRANAGSASAPPSAIGETWATQMFRCIMSRGVSKSRKAVDLVLLLFGWDIGLIPRSVRRAAVDAVRTGRYRAMIGVEKGGLIWAAAVARRKPAPLIYLNLELFTAEMYSTWGSWHPRMKAAESRAHRQCRATIVQDEIRGQILLKDNQVRPDMKMVYLPVSRSGGPHPEKSRWLQAALQLPSSSIIVLSHGMISEDRYTTALARVAQSFEDDWVLVFHGWGWNVNSVIESAKRADEKNKVRFSLQLVDVSEEVLIAASSQIALVLYGKSNLNDQLTGFSSEKIALSLQCGVPVIAFNYPTYEHIESEGCGVLVNELSEIPDAVRRVLADYTNYRARAFATFDRHYSFETNFNCVLATLDTLPQAH
jgi:glycosyltransferase involved in cell wall biosynthesis